MDKKSALIVFTSVFLLLAMARAQFIMPASTDPAIIRVPKDYPTIQEAINAASSGDVILVAAGTYYEHLTINKSLMLIGQDKSSTVIDGNGTGNVISITAGNVSIDGFTVRNGESGWAPLTGNIHIINCSGSTISGNIITSKSWHGILLESTSGNTIIDNQILNNGHLAYLGGGGGIKLLFSDDNMISNNVMIDNLFGVSLFDSSNNTIVGNRMSNNVTEFTLSYSDGNIISNNIITSKGLGGIELYSSSRNIVSNNTLFGCGEGIRLSHSNNDIFVGNTISGSYRGIVLAVSNDNIIVGNTISGSDEGIMPDECWDNIIYHNNFINNVKQVYDPSWDYPWNDPSINVWDNGVEGNYWSDYKGVDLNGDGIGDIPYTIDKNNTDNYPLMGMFSDFPVTLEGETHHVTTVSNSTVSAFYFNQSSRTIGFNISGPEGTMGFCRVMFPKVLIGDDPYNVTVDSLPPLTLKELPTSNSTHAFLYFTYVHSTREVKIFPEFPAALIPPLLIITALLATILRKMIRSTKNT